MCAENLQPILSPVNLSPKQTSVRGKRLQNYKCSTPQLASQFLRNLGIWRCLSEPLRSPTWAKCRVLLGHVRTCRVLWPLPRREPPKCQTHTHRTPLTGIERVEGELGSNDFAQNFEKKWRYRNKITYCGDTGVPPGGKDKVTILDIGDTGDSRLFN